METRIRFVSPPSPCGYLPDRMWQLEYELGRDVTQAEYMLRLREGWRRIGRAMFRPVCSSCRLCRSLRVPAGAFHPDRSQRRAWKRNAGEVSVTIGTAAMSLDRAGLFEKFHAFQTGAKGWPAHDEDNLWSLVDNPFPTEEWCYWIGGRLVGVGYVDRLAEGLSAIYFYYDPDERDRSLGTFNVLSLIAAAQDQRLPYVYLGYYVEGYGSLAYKARFRPNEVLERDGTWRPFAQRHPV